MPALEIIVAAVLLVSLMAYALTGGADFGGGFWDLCATGPRAKAQRAVIADAIAPIWEANHVWLILVVVLLFVCFPKAFAAISTALHIPLTLMLLGIVLRGSAFVFRAYDAHDDQTQRRWSLVFSIASTLTPWMLGVTLGAVTAGNLPIHPKTGVVQTDFISAWLAPFPLVLGVFVVALFAYLAAVYLLLESDDPDLQEDFRRRAFASGIAVGLLAWACLALAPSGAPRLATTLLTSSFALPLQAGIGLFALLAFFALWKRAYTLARFAAILQTLLLLGAWGLSQYPYLLAPDLTIFNASAPDSVLLPTLLTLGIGSFLLLPAFWYLYSIFKNR